MGLACGIILILLFASTANAASLCVDSATSHVRIHVASAGLFSGLGHDHQIEARSVKGCAEVDWSHLERTSVSLAFSTPAITVLDPDHPKDQPKVQQTMESEVLQVKEYPSIQFKSSSVRVNGSTLTVDGSLTIRGQTRKVSIPMRIEHTGNDAKATGHYALKLTAFGIKPVQVMGGMVKVKDEIQLDFDLHLH